VPDSDPPRNQNNALIPLSGSAVAGARMFACWCAGVYDGTTRKVFKTDLTKSEVAAVLTLNLGGTSPTSFQGEVTDNEFRISVVHKGTHNAWLPVLCGRIDRGSVGCRVVTHFDIAPSSKVFTTKWLCGSVIFASVLLMCFDWNVVTIWAFFLPVFGVFLVRLGRHFGKADEKKLLGLMESIHASSSSSSSSISTSSSSSSSSDKVT